MTRHHTLSGTILLTIVLLLSFAPLCSAATIIASVIALRGEASLVKPDGNVRPLQMKDVLSVEDTITTGATGRLQILFSDNTIISIGKKSSITLSEYFLAEDKTGTLKTTASEGVFRVMGGILTKTSPDNFVTKTPSGTIGIRGSMYAAQIADSKLAVVFEGGTAITLQNNTGVIDIAIPGAGTTCRSINQPIEPPHIFEAAELDAIHNEFTPVAVPAGQDQAKSQSRLKVTPHFSPQDLPADKSSSGKQQRDLLSLTNQTRTNQDKASQILRNAVLEQGIPLESALRAVLMGMQNSTREAFDAVVKEAIDQGITPKQVNDLKKDLPKDEVCK